MEDPRNFPEVPSVITTFTKSGDKLNIWDVIAATKKSFPQSRMGYMS